MKRIFIALTVLLIIGLAACNQKQKDSRQDGLTNKNVSPIEGNWVTYALNRMES